MRLALFQMRIMKDPRINRKRVQRAFSKAKDRGADLLMLPEYWVTGFQPFRLKEEASLLSGGLFHELSEWACEYRLPVIGWGPRKTGQNIRNTALFIDEQGVIQGVYDKIHLFPSMGEDRYLEAGKCPTVVDTPWGRWGLAVCFDLRFPELFRKLTLEGAWLVAVPAFWPQPRLEHWRLLLRARAVENQCYIAGCNAASADNVRLGRSAVIGPMGEVLVEAGATEKLIVADIDPSRVQRAREPVAYLDCRRPDVFQQ
ncbi:MAG TPA: carbon-nitrogen family hydrolase [bacterium]|nr:carbon-nitrogen family hydrolase [bacterium]